MRIKSYFAGNVTEAMEKARREMGPEAMLLNSKKTDADLRSLGEYEVVFAIPPDNQRAVAARPAVVPVKPSTARPAPRQPVLASPVVAAAPKPVVEVSAPPHDFARELADLRSQIETVKRSVSQSMLPRSGATPLLAQQEAEWIAKLVADGISPEFSSELAGDMALARGDLHGGETASPDALLRSVWERRLAFSASLGVPGSTPRVVMLVGAPGVGKTTTLIKLALRYGLRGRLPLQLLSLDTLRVGGWEQLTSFARITGLPCEVLHTPQMLEEALAEYSNKKLVLIDTAGLSPADADQAAGLIASLRGGRAEIEVQLVLSAAVQTRVNLRVAERFAPFAPAKAIYTHLDELEGNGSLMETAARLGLPVSFLANGPQVPDDLHEATLERLLGALTVAAKAGRIASAA